MSRENFVGSRFVAGRVSATLSGALVVALGASMSLSLGGCHKDPPHRAKRTHPHPAAAPAAAADDDPPVAPAPPPAAAPPAAPVPAAAAPPAQPLSARLRHQLTVDRTVPSPSPSSSSARPHVVAAAAVAPEPAPAAPPPEYKAVNDSVPPASRCEGGSGTGERLTVQGVAANDVLNVRESPDKASAILGELPPDATGVRGTANRRRVGASTWREVECGKLRGWVNERFLAHESAP